MRLRAISSGAGQVDGHTATDQLGIYLFNVTNPKILSDWRRRQFNLVKLTRSARRSMFEAAHGMRGGFLYCRHFSHRLAKGKTADDCEHAVGLKVVRSSAQESRQPYAAGWRQPADAVGAGKPAVIRPSPITREAAQAVLAR